MEISNQEVINFFLDKKEHYPISDEFIKKYQQKTLTKDSYITYAVLNGHVVCEELAEPNQKWHLLEAYFLQNAKNKGTDFYKKKNTCCQLKCPELFLWMAEAAGVDEEVLRFADKAAREAIDKYKKSNDNFGFSKYGVSEMKNKVKDEYKKTLWSFIEEKIGGTNSE